MTIREQTVRDVVDDVLSGASFEAWSEGLEECILGGLDADSPAGESASKLAREVLAEVWAVMAEAVETRYGR
jgi:hypothetical protein